MMVVVTKKRKIMVILVLMIIIIIHFTRFFNGKRNKVGDACKYGVIL